DAGVDAALGRIELRPRLEQIELRGYRLPTQGVSRGFVIAATQPAAKLLAANGPGFSVTVDRDICKCGASGGVKQLLTWRHIDEHIGGWLGRRLAVDHRIVGFCGSIGSGTLRPRLRLHPSPHDAGVVPTLSGRPS